ncbi:hypothetical protein VOLCADRAFT_93025 [Volvox carteri f. nagariensis]|uniref:Uncharacterized protein n=1 Tax=Volvox carteri f. nagariensis TaxID=3068 RepID=D8U153_VOLCA|nr:uncharacterized protein VOLCADRAFT_93025 [Volvox carteri f. nagariensis]EFJ46572.1 hypothetical protein VOLCADRAFT_93025 [Volvox carteri f. nagariensis]|eukprot:XP_002952429.1 hypothetical protein VOLCADRAFT_93025 [Volvox carteri f. nagariensis]
MVRASPLAKESMSLDGTSALRWRLVSARSTEQRKLLKLERASHTATVVNGNIYVIAGRKGSTFYGDLLLFDTATHSWSILTPAIPNGFRPRANHTATLVGGRYIWVIAGSDNEKVMGDAHVFDVQTQTWTKPHVRGDITLLSRTAHSAELHPCDPRAILLFGGYDGAVFHNDLVVIRTDALAVERVELSVGGVPPPVPRGYHSCTAAGSRCYVYGGRTETGVVDASGMLAVFDAAGNRWLAPHVEGKWPQARSSHRAVALGSRLLIHGGAAAGEQTDRLADVHTLLICPHTGRLTWSRMDEPPAVAGSASNARPQGRSAHTVGQLRSQLSPKHIPKPTDRSSPHHAPKVVTQANGGPAAPTSGATNGNLSRPASPLREDAAAAAAAGGASRGAKRRLVPTASDKAPAQAQQPAGNLAMPTRGLRDGGGAAEAYGAGAEDDPIDLTADQLPDGTQPKVAAGAPSWVQHVPRTRGDAVEGGEPALRSDGGWLGGQRRGRVCSSMQQQMSEDAAAAEAKDAERQANQKLAEQQRRAAEELSMQRRSCEMTQEALRTANTELEEARSQLEHLQQDLVVARQQAAAHQQQQAAAARQAADRERALLQERELIMQQLVETGCKYQEQIKSLEALSGRHQAEADKYRRDLHAEAERHSEAAAALRERLGKWEQDATELTNRLREAAAQNQKLQQELARLQDVKQRLERDTSEAREAQQRLQRQMDEQVGDLARQRDSLQMQVTHTTTRISALESELRRTKDDLAHRDVQHAALLQASADKAAELAGVRELLRAAQQKQEVMRQQASLLATQMQTAQATVQAIANGV